MVSALSLGSKVGLSFWDFIYAEPFENGMRCVPYLAGMKEGYISDKVFV